MTCQAKSTAITLTTILFLELLFPTTVFASENKTDHLSSRPLVLYVSDKVSDNKANNVTTTDNLYNALPETKKYILIDPLPKRTYGVFCETNPYNEYNSYANSGEYGFTLTQDPQNIKQMILKTYKLDWDKPGLKGDIVLQKIDDTGDRPKPSSDKRIIKTDIGPDSTVTISLPGTGTWCITWDTPYYDIVGYASVTNNKAQALRLNVTQASSVIKDWETNKQKMINKAALDTTLTRYPVEENDPLSDLNQTKEIQNLSNTLISDMEKKAGRKLTDSEKTYTLIKYMYDNYAYDRWRMNTSPTEWRADILKDCKNPMNFTYSSHVGVCWDYTTIFVIMARQQNIPAIGISNDKHIMPAAYINGEWISFDITKIIPRECPTKDISVKNWRKYNHDGKWFDYMACNPDLFDIFVTYTMWDNSPAEAYASYYAIKKKY